MNDSSTFVVRKLIEADNEQYRALWWYAITEHSQFFRIAPEDESTKFIPTRLADDSFTVGAFLDGRLVGIVSVERDSKKKMNHKALVFRMFVHPDAAGMGLGRQLLKEAIRGMVSINSIRYLYLTVLATNERAVHLYSSLGFKEFARESGAVCINGEYVDELQMALTIQR
ncbi:MAG TPA: GNAT family N-acetyltransferase [Steroidobacteraceae bacterium]|nr:GNAT family N-acetyltransferase [Steroidobacteraceae bacterium]